MGTYKVIQDIEAEDKLLGPLSLRQFIYAVIVVVSLFISFKLANSGAWFMIFPFVPVILFFGLLAAPFGHDQSSEVWLLAKIRFWVKPKKRLWDQSGIKELVTITVPKKIEKRLTKDFTKDEARSRLQALANTLDSRGWAVKNVDSNSYQPPVIATNNYGASQDRLIVSGQVPQAVPDIDELGIDVLDERNNPNTGHVDQLISQAEVDRQAKLRKIVSGVADTSSPSPRQGLADYEQTSTTNSPSWFTDSSSGTGSSAPLNQSQPLQQTKPNDTMSEDYLLPVNNQSVTQSTDNNSPPILSRPATTSDTETNTDIINLSTNDDLNVATIARQADKAIERSDDNNEVVISLR